MVPLPLHLFQTLPQSVFMSLHHSKGFKNDADKHSVAENKKKHTSAATNVHETFKTEFTPLKELAFTGLVQKQMFV